MADDEEVEEEAVRQEEEEEAAAEVKLLDPPLYEVRPGLGEKFKAEAVKYIITSSMEEQLLERQYRADQVPRWCKTIANGIRQRVQDLDMKRYKIVVQTTIFEMRGAGIKCGQRCIWDPETDSYVDDVFRSDTLYCHSIVYGIYMY